MSETSKDLKVVEDQLADLKQFLEVISASHIPGSYMFVAAKHVSFLQDLERQLETYKLTLTEGLRLARAEEEEAILAQSWVDATEEGEEVQ